MLQIVTLPTKSLKERSTEIDRDVLLSEETQNLIKEMYPTMNAADGIGLAAVQVKKNIRLCTIGKAAIPENHEIWKKLKQKPGDIVLINPKWEKTSRKKTVDYEGCLSVPGKTGEVKRYKNIHVEALDGQGNPFSFDAEDYFARVIQHEVDHLDGILFIDRAINIQIVE